MKKENQKIRNYWNLGIWVRLGFNFRSGIGI
jgi:hypothetical protein